MEVITRMEAAKLGLLRFYTGKPCKHGHDSERYTRTNTCIECAKLATDRYNQKIREVIDEARGVTA
jgi:hypothetical protein